MIKNKNECQDTIVSLHTKIDVIKKRHGKEINEKNELIKSMNKNIDKMKEEMNKQELDNKALEDKYLALQESMALRESE